MQFLNNKEHLAIFTEQLPNIIIIKKENTMT